MADTGKRLNGEGSIRQRKDGRWQCRLSTGIDPLTGKPTFKYIYGATLREVRSKMKDFLDSPDEIVTPQGIYVRKEESPESMLYSDWLDTWLTQYKKNSIRPSSYEAYRIMIKYQIKPGLGNIELSAINADNIQFFLNKLQEKGSRCDGNPGSLSSTTIVKAKNIINASLKQAVKNRLIPFNPTEAVVAPKMVRKEIRILTVDEQSQLMKAFRGHRLEALFKMALATGMRRGELLALTWDKIDFKSNTITVDKSVVRIRDQDTMKTRMEVGEPKSASGYRVIPMLFSIAPILENHYLRQQKEIKDAGNAYNKLNLVFCSVVGTHLEPARINGALNKFIKEADLEHINFHALRHTFATRALEIGIPARVVQEILGHSDVSLTLNRYTHVLKSTTQDQMKKMDALFTELEMGNAPSKDTDKKNGRTEPEKER